YLDVSQPSVAGTDGNHFLENEILLSNPPVAVQTNLVMPALQLGLGGPAGGPGIGSGQRPAPDAIPKPGPHPHALLGRPEPVLNALGNLTLTLSATKINEGGSVTLRGSFSDPGSLGSTVTISWGDHSSNSVLSLPAGVFTFNAPHQYLDNPVGQPTG